MAKKKTDEPEKIKKEKAEKTEQTEQAEKVEEKEDGENKKLSDRLLRITAEYDNFRKRTEREKLAIYGDAKADTVARFLPIYDVLEKAIAQKPENAEGEWKAFSDGIELTQRKLCDILKELGAEPIEALGQEFNPELHNAVMHVDDEEAGENTVVEEFQKGFKSGDRVIRHSVVKVAN